MQDDRNCGCNNGIFGGCGVMGAIIQYYFL